MTRIVTVVVAVIRNEVSNEFLVKKMENVKPFENFILENDNI